MPKVQLRMEAQSGGPKELPTLQDAAGYSPEGVVYKLCKRGHVKSPENVTKHGECKECKKLYSKMYMQGPKWKEYQRSPVRKSKQNEREKEHLQSHEYRNRRNERQREHRRSQRYKELINKKAADITDYYISQLLRIPMPLIPPELTQIMRANIKLKREIKNANSK